MDPLILQTGIAAPVVLGLTIHTWLRRTPGGVHSILAALLMMILVWMVGMAVVSQDAAPNLWASVLLIPPACLMSPLFLLVMLRHTRAEILQYRGVIPALMLPFLFFMAAFLTQNSHGMMVDAHDRTLGSEAKSVAGPLFWAFQFWTNAVAAAGLGICFRIGSTSPRAVERRRMRLLGVAAGLPLVTHCIFILQILPIPYPLTPLALGLSSLMLVAAIGKYRLLDLQPLARRDVVEASNDGVVIADETGRVVDINSAGARLLGMDRADACGRSLQDLFSRLGDFTPSERVVQMLEALGQGETPPTLEIETIDGRIFELSGGVPNDALGESAGYFVVLRDRSHERRGERLLHQTQKLESVGTLAAGIAHEVNNPLSFVRANFTHLEHLAAVVQDELELLPQKVAEELREMPEVIQESIAGIDRIQQIVQGLLRFSRMPTGRRTRCDANAVLDEAARFAALDRRGAAPLETTIDESVPAIHASSEQLTQAILNLLLNAKHALEDVTDGRIVATTNYRDPWVEIRVADNGPGVPDAVRQKIFDPFFTTREPGEGTGLGLAIAFDIVREHGGTLDLENLQDRGACFVIRLPAILEDGGEPVRA